jgi:perosamine synthetase
MQKMSASPVTVPPVRVVFEASDRKRILDQIDAVLASGMVAAGKKVREFEELWAAYCGTQHAVACANGGAALEIIVRSLGAAGKDVLVPTNTFIATANAVTANGGRPVFLDADPKTMGVTVSELQRKRTPHTTGVIVVHIGGIISPEMPAITGWCREQGLWLVEDAAHAHGSECQGLRAGRFGIAAAYSFFSTKVMTAGEGGMVVTNDPGLAETCRRLIDYGKRSQWESIHTEISNNYRISEITAVIGLEQARRLDEFIAARAAVARTYTARLTGVLPLILPEDRSSWYKYVALLPAGVERQQFRTQLKEAGISLSGGVYDLPVHLQPVYEPHGLKGTLPLAEDLCARHICLPIFYGLTEAQADHVVSTVQRLLA